MSLDKPERKTCCYDVEFHLKPSRIRKSSLLGLHVLAVISVWLSSLAVLWCVFLSVFLCVSAVHCWRAPGFSPVMRYTPTSGWECCYSSAGFVPMTIMQSTTMGSIAIFISYRTALQPNGAVMVVHDSLSADDFRRLNVWLRITSQSARYR